MSGSNGSGRSPAPSGALETTPLAKLLDRASELAALFTVSVERATYLVEQGNSRIEVALDHGRITKPGVKRSSDVAFISELELKEGSATDLFALAREISARVPVRLGIASKAERGFKLMAAESGRYRKAKPIALSDEMSAADAFRTIAHGCLHHLRLNEDVLLDHRDADALHQARVAIRRLRSAISLFKELLADDGLEGIKAALKRLSEPLGWARNLDVVLSQTLPTERARIPDLVEFLNLEKHLEGQRVEAYAAVLQQLRSEEWRHFFVDLVCWIQAGPWLSEADATRRDQPVLTFAASVLDKRRRQVKKRGRKLAALSPEERHQVRIAAKKLRYGAEFFGGLYAGKKVKKCRKAFLTALSKLQDSLGVVNDIASGHDLLDRLTGSDAGDAIKLVTASMDAKTQKLLASAAKAHEELAAVRPFWR